MPDVIVCITPNGIGGAEKRFTGIWCGLKKDGRIPNLKLALHQDVYKLLSSNIEFKSALQQYKDDIILFDFKFNTNFLTFRQRAKIFRDAFTKSNDIIHFIGVSPLIASKGRRIHFSITASSLKILNWKGQLTQIISAIHSSRTDVLDPLIYRLLQMILPFRKKSFSMTPGSYCNTDLFKPAEFKHKQNAIVFLGRLEEGKQIMPFVQAIPLIYNSLKNIVPDITFHIHGSGALEPDMMRLLESDEYKKLPIRTGFLMNTEQLLSTTKVFLSLQRYNNYPSKSLLEAMSSGNIPLVTDCGTTSLMVTKEFGFFIPELFSAEQLNDCLVKLFSETDEVLQHKANLARKMVLDKYTFKASLDYFYQFYRL